MSDMEKTMQLEMNPYDRLVEDSRGQSSESTVQAHDSNHKEMQPAAEIKIQPAEPMRNGMTERRQSVQPNDQEWHAGIGDAGPARAIQEKSAPAKAAPLQPVEIIPLSDKAVFTTLDTREYGNTYNMTVELEEDMLVPDTEPDMEMILNSDAFIESLNFNREDGEGLIRGEIALELLYCSTASYNGKIFTLKNKVPFKRDWKENFAENAHVEVYGRVKSAECRIVNERKYRAKISMEITAREIIACQRKLFENIQGEELEFLREKASILNVAFTKNKESEINEKLPVNNEKIRPLQILKSSFTIAENHRQLTSDKLVVNETIWVQILYTAEIASQGNLSSQPMMFTGKIDNTGFIPLDDRSNIFGCSVRSDVSGLSAEINEEANGFVISGQVKTKVDFFNLVEKEVVADFYNKNDDMACDNKEELTCCGMETKISGQTVRETIEIQEGTPEPDRIIYMNGNVMDYTIDEGERQIQVNGKMQMEALMAASEGPAILARKTCDFSQIVELPGEGSYVADSHILIREITGDILNGQQINMMVQLQLELDICHEGHIKMITNPCIIREEGRGRNYPLVLYTVKDNDTLWDIAKRYRVPMDQLIKVNGVETLTPGMKIVVAK